MELPKETSGIFGQALHPGDIEDGGSSSPVGGGERRRLNDLDELNAFHAIEASKVRRFSTVQIEHGERSGGAGNKVWPGEL